MASAAAVTSVAPEDVLNRPSVATVIIPDREDPGAVLSRGGLEVTWKDGTKYKKFKKMECKDEWQLTDEELSLPELYLHFLDARFKVRPGEFDPALRAGNDNAEVQLVLPEMYTAGDLPAHDGGEDLQQALGTVMGFLKTEATVPVSAVATRPGAGNYTVSADPGRWYYSLRTSRPKADINLDKAAFGIPDDSQVFLFAENHISVNFMTEEQVEAFEYCLERLSDEDVGDDWHQFAIFIKIFFEGAFSYNKREATGAGSYLPRNTGLAALGTKPARDGQSGVSTGHPYLVRPEFLNFSDSVPVTIKAIKAMSNRHHRYGLLFTRCVFLWEDADIATTKALSFASILPHGGFFYMPATLDEFNREGGLVYAFGERTTSLGAAMAGDAI